MRKLLPYAHKGRVHVDLQDFLRLGTAGIVERSRFTLAPPGLSAKWPAGRTIDSRQCFEAQNTKWFLRRVNEEVPGKETLLQTFEEEIL